MILHLDAEKHILYNEMALHQQSNFYAVMNISYPAKVITIQDQVLSRYLAESNRSFLYNFIVPIHHFSPSSSIFSKSLFCVSARKTNLSTGFPTLESPKSLNSAWESKMTCLQFILLTAWLLNPLCLSGYCRLVKTTEAFLYYLLASRIKWNYTQIASTAKSQKRIVVVMMMEETPPASMNPFALVEKVSEISQLVHQLNKRETFSSLYD